MSSSPREQPPSRRIAEALRAAIERGDYVEGDQLPSERVLASRYGAARNTAREAISLLQAEGLLDVRHGRGAFVRPTARMIRLGADRYSSRLRRETGLSPFRVEAQKVGKTARVQVPEIARVRPPTDVAERLGVSTDEESVVRRTNHYFADEEPVQIGLTYIPWVIAEQSPLAAEVTAPGSRLSSIYNELEHLGHRLARVREEITARMPRPDEVETLRIPPGVPVLQVLHTGMDDDGQAFEVTRFTMRADLNALDYMLPVED